MQFASTRNSSPTVGFAEAVTRGLAPDGGLYIPVSIPKLSAREIEALPQLTLTEIGTVVAKYFLSEDFSTADIGKIVRSAITFEAPWRSLSPGLHSLELFHGPTLAFKDFGARFLAQVISRLPNTSDKPVTILVATSGDTGGAVADGFFGVGGVRVVVLYPRGGVTPLQESQFATLGGNVRALEVQGTFDDCQRLVKQAFLDPQLSTELRLSSANSINIARLIPQTFYYFAAAAQRKERPFIVSVPSGNFGNLTAGVLAQKMGAPIDHFIAATNVNKTVPVYLDTGRFDPAPSIATLSNAMDVGDPNNFPRLGQLFRNDWNSIRQSITGSWHTDEQTRSAMRELFARYGYVADPHGAVAYLGLQQPRLPVDADLVFLETAHPVKFHETVTEVLGQEVEIPAALRVRMEQPKQSLPLQNNYEELRTFLRSLDESSSS